MNKLKKMILMLCLILSGALCYAVGAAGMENEIGEGTPIEVKLKVIHGGLDKSNSINLTINGHLLFVAFDENLGRVSVDVATVTGVSVQCLSVLTPNGLQIYIPNAGDYVVTFTLSKGDEYYGEFTVTE